MAKWEKHIGGAISRTIRRRNCNNSVTSVLQTITPIEKGFWYRENDNGYGLGIVGCTLKEAHEYARHGLPKVV